MAITPAGVAPPTTPTTSTTSAQSPQSAPPAQPAATTPPPNQSSTFANAGQGAPVAGVGGNVPAAPPAPLTGEQFGRGTIYDATAYLADRLKLLPGGELRIFHREHKVWPGATPGEKTWISTKFSGGNFGKGFYTSTRPETGYGNQEFQVAIPVNAFQGKKVLELPYSYFGDQLQMPPGVDVIVVRQNGNKDVWFIFKPGSDAWLNASATTADWDKPGEQVGWS